MCDEKTVPPTHRPTRQDCLGPGDKAPAFTLPDQDEKKVSLRDFAGKPVVVYFYPADDTPGCTKEACQFNDNLRAFSRAGVAVLGVSPDGAAKHTAFRQKYGLRFPLLTDAGHAVMERYGAWGEKTLYGKKSVGVIRSTFLVGADGKVQRAWYHVKADGHAEKVLAESSGGLSRRSTHLVGPGRPAAGQCWWAGHHQLVRPPTVERTSSAPSRGQRPPGARSGMRSPRCDPPRRMSSSRVRRADDGGVGGVRPASVSRNVGEGRERRATAPRRR